MLCYAQPKLCTKLCIKFWPMLRPELVRFWLKVLRCVVSTVKAHIYSFTEMQLILLLISCLMTLITSLTVSTNLFLQYLELRLILMGQIVTVINLFLRGESLWTLSPNILGSFAICLMDLYQNTDPNVDDEPDLFFILPLGFLIISPVSYTHLTLPTRTRV